MRMLERRLWSLNREIVVNEEIIDLTFGGSIKTLYRQTSWFRNEYQPRYFSKFPIFRCYNEDSMAVNICSLILCFPVFNKLAASQSK